MRFILTVFILMVAVARAAVPGQPWAGLWHLKDTDPAYLLNYSIASDPDAPYMRSGTALAARGRNAAFKVNANARSGEGGVTALSSFHAANNNPAQGEKTAAFLDYYAFAHWQYVNQLVMWGGSAGAGIVLAPNPTLIDTAHRSGVPVFGNIFFPPTAFGGKIEWVQALVQKSGSNYVIADKLIEIANWCGFDGWFINQETDGGDAALATEVRNFIKYIHTNSALKVMWYDAMTESGTVTWQDTLNTANDTFFQDGATLVSDSFFADFGWTAAKVNTGVSTATSLSRSPFDVYFGIDVQADGFNTVVNWANVWPTGAAHKASVGLYQPNWTFDKSNNDSTVFYQRERQFWSGPNENPANTPGTAGTSDWEGIAHYVQEWTPVRSAPFVTSFNVGHGNRFWWKGVLVRPALDSAGVTFNWHNLTTQDILPSWQWIVETTSATPLTPAWLWNDAYTGGSCLKVSGTLDAINDLKLYAANLSVTATTSLRVVYKDNDANTATNLKLALAFTDAPTTWEYIAFGNRAGTGWSTKIIDLSAYAGRTVGAIGFRFDPTATGTVSSYSMQFGELAFYNGTLTAPAAASGVTIENAYDVSSTRKSLRVRWTPSASTNVRSYNVYRRNADSSRTWLWAASKDACFVPEVDRAGTETSTTIEVETVSAAMETSTPATTTLFWNDPPSISNITAKTITEGSATTAIAFTVDDALTPAADLTLVGSSSNTALVPDSGIVFGGSGTSRTVTVTPNASAHGVATITITVTDAGGLTASDPFTLTVTPADGVSGALARWPFDGNLGDTTGNGRDLTHSGTATFATFKQQGSRSLQLNGTSERAATTSTVPVGDAFTACAWIHVPSGTSQIQTVLANSSGGNTTSGFRFYVNTFNTGDAKLLFATGNGTAGANVASATGTIAFDRWQHVAAVVDRLNGTATLYRNGIQVASGTIRTDFANDALIYAGAMSTQFWFRSHLDEARLYDHALSPAELAAIVNVANNAPVISNVADVAVVEDFGTGPLSFTIDDAETTGGVLAVSAASSNTTLLPQSGITLGGSGLSRTITLTPAANQNGTATVTLNVNDGTLTSSDTFVLTVTPDTPNTDWLQANFGSSWTNSAIAGDLADPDRDGIVNLLEYALGGNPNTGATTALPQAAIGNNKLALVFTRTLANTDITMTVQAADSLTGPWTDLASSINGAAFTVLASGAGVVQTGSGATRTVEVRDQFQITNAAHPRRYMRLVVVK